MSVAVITSVYGSYDPVVPPQPQSVDVDWICVTDTPDAIPAPWRVVVEHRPHLHPRMAAKLPRCRPDIYTDADVTVWLDASARIKTPDTIARLVETPGTVRMFSHPERSAIEDEANYCVDMEKYRGLPMNEQCAAYRKAGLPGTGLWATGCIVRNGALPGFGDRWLTEMWRWGWQDQLSVPYALWECGLKATPLPGNLWSNDLVEWSYGNRRSNA